MSDVYEHDGPGNAGSVRTRPTYPGDPCDAVRRTGLPKGLPQDSGESSTEVASLRFFKKDNS